MASVSGTETILSPLQRSGLNKKGLCDYVVNVASGCLHGCTFCYVPSTPTIRTRQEHFRTSGVNDPQMDWGDYLLLRDKLPEKLEEQLNRKRTWKETEAGKGVVLLCSGTDPYQNNRVAKITRQSVKILLKSQKRIRILTRSPLWLKDLDVLMDRNVTIGMSLPHLDDQLSRQIEPHAPLPSDRLKALYMGKKSGCRLYVAIAPTVPQMGKKDFLEYLGKILPLEPEVIFWEPINARGSNGKRMLSAGLSFAASVMSHKDWAENFLKQWNAIEEAAAELGCLDILHIWPDPALNKYISSDRLETWFYRPTVEVW
ncbi:radical SAM protein [Nodosilinea sp. FACHB-131]|uniref:SPL family radical SAM protein n=1 Tax=Cyanophyceae TaxID=3028117 RepID=UPI001685EEE6|nr:radical SAM protein [Nodosilinea sp. FACHB-131]MBD1874343.1 radical SAM protein [Nodosilinea sp. FACHB-131]